MGYTKMVFGKWISYPEKNLSNESLKKTRKVFYVVSLAQNHLDSESWWRLSENQGEMVFRKSDFMKHDNEKKFMKHDNEKKFMKHDNENAWEIFSMPIIGNRTK